MMHFVGLDVSVKETSVCVVDDAGKVLRERKVPTEPDDIAVLLTSIGGDYVRVGIEAGFSTSEGGMEYYAGIDVSLDTVSVCIVDGTGKVPREAKVLSRNNRIIG
jgi:predicted NBD/HSP70 family sugar kinase